MNEALVVLPGITANAAKTAFLLEYFERHLAFPVFLPKLWQPLGIRGAARRLHRFLAKIGPFDRIHFLAYVSGGFILRAALPVAGAPIGRLVYVRSPIQEEVPGRFIRQRGRLAAVLGGGRMLFDLSSGWKDDLPYPVPSGAQGLVIERGVSRLARKLGLDADDFDGLRHSPGFRIPAANETWEAAESHDDAYTSAALLARIARFLATGTFAGPPTEKEKRP